MALPVPESPARSQPYLWGPLLTAHVQTGSSSQVIPACGQKSRRGPWFVCPQPLPSVCLMGLPRLPPQQHLLPQPPPLLCTGLLMSPPQLAFPQALLSPLLPLLWSLPERCLQASGYRPLPRVPTVLSPCRAPGPAASSEPETRVCSLFFIQLLTPWPTSR